MSLQEFDAVIKRMQDSFEYALNLGQKIDAVKILYQMNEQLPDDLQLTLDEIDSEESIPEFISKYKSEIKFAISEYRQRMMNI